MGFFAGLTGTWLYIPDLAFVVVLERQPFCGHFPFMRKVSVMVIKTTDSGGSLTDSFYFLMIG